MQIRYISKSETRLVNVERLEKPIYPEDTKYGKPVHCKFCSTTAMYRVTQEIWDVIVVSYYCVSCLGKRVID
jgi:hypothetical protein